MNSNKLEFIDVFLTIDFYFNKRCLEANQKYINSIENEIRLMGDSELIFWHKKIFTYKIVTVVFRSF
jgi:hypothetical protein